MEDAHADPSPYELPRFGVIHLLGLTTATAVAFVPYQLLYRSVKFTQSTTELGSLVVFGSSAVHGIATGVFIYVVAALAYQGRRGNGGRLEPGHWIAIHGVVQWVASAATWFAVINSVEGGNRFTLLAVIPQFLLATVFFFVFLALSIRSSFPTRWRLVFAVMALAPVAAWLLRVVSALTLTYSTHSLVGYLAPQIFATVVQGVVVAVALLGDLRSDGQPHWSHLLPVAMQLLLIASTIASYGYYVVFLPR